jgi:adenylate cyclase
MVGAHGNLISNILQEKFLRTIPRWINLVITVLFGIVVGCFIHWLGPLYSAVLSIALLLLGAMGAYYLFTAHGLIVAIVAPAFAVVFSYLIITLYRYITEEKKKRWIKMAFSHYLSPVVIEQIIKNPDQLKLGGERHVITVLFSDIRSFTTFSEKHTSEEVVNILNEYLEAMTKVILNNKGTIDKFVGDEIMALFGAPVRMEIRQQAYCAVKTSLEMLDALKVLHAKWKGEGKPLLGMGVGINTGEMICGNMGSSGIFDYTVIGDNVNIGARVEALTRKYECDIIITEATYEYVKDLVDANKLDSIVVKGKTKPIQIYSVMGLKASVESPIVTAE